MSVRGMGRVYRRGGVFWIQYYHRGEKFRESTRTDSRAQANAFLKRRVAELGRGLTRPRDAERLTFSELAQLLEDDYKLNGRKSIARARLSIANLRWFFGRSVAADITPDRVAAYIRSRIEDEERPVKPATVRCEVAALKRMLTLAVQNGLIPFRPAFPRISVDNVRTGFFEEEQLSAVLSHLPEHLRPVVLFAYRTGWRRSEVLGLKWSNVDLAAGIVRLEPGRTKNRDGRTFPFAADPMLRGLIREQRAWTRRREMETEQVIPWVFAQPSGKPLANFYGAWRKACQAAGVPGRIFHDLRRTAVRNLERAGVSRSVAMKLTGHKTEAVYRRYAIVSEADLAEGVTKLGAGPRRLGLA